MQDNGTTNGAADFKTGTAVASFAITEVNDAPSGVNDPLSSVAVNSGERTIAFATLLGNDSPGPANESGQTLTITQVGSAVGGTVSIVGTNVIFTPTADFSGPASFTYTLQDNGTTNGAADFKTSTAVVTFVIGAVNQAPSFIKGADQAATDVEPRSNGSWLGDGNLGGAAERSGAVTDVRSLRACGPAGAVRRAAGDRCGRQAHVYTATQRRRHGPGNRRAQGRRRHGQRRERFQQPADIQHHDHQAAPLV